MPAFPSCIRPSALAAALALALSWPAVHAAVDVYAQPLGSTSFGDTSGVANIVGDPGFTWTLDSDEEVWVYFVATATGSFNQITWYGSATDGKFGVDFFPASCFSCGATWVATNGRFTGNQLPNPGPWAPSAVKKKQLASNVYAYTIKLSAQVPVTIGTLYAISVVNNYTALPFQWSVAKPIAGQTPQGLHYINGQAMFLRTTGELAFRLTNTAAASAAP